MFGFKNETGIGPPVLLTTGNCARYLYVTYIGKIRNFEIFRFNDYVHH